MSLNGIPKSLICLVQKKNDMLKKIDSHAKQFIFSQIWMKDLSFTEK